jgi:hypothetical protein
MGDPPEGMSLERKDVNGQYSPENCCWIPIRNQSKNRRTSLYLTLNGRTQIAIEWAAELGISNRTISSRRRLGWSDEKILTTPVRQTRRRRSEVGDHERRTITKAEKLAWALSLIERDGTPLIPADIRARGTKAILAHVQWDHITPLAMGGSNHFSNLQPLSKDDHREKTRKDVRAIAKSRRIARAQAAHKVALAEKYGHIDVTGGMDGGRAPHPKPKRRWPSRKMQSRPFPKRPQR